VYEFYKVWKDGRTHVVAPLTPNAKERFKINFVVFEDNKFKALVFEFGVSVNNQLFELSQEYDLEKTKVKITRIGEGLKTLYSITPLDPIKHPISKEKLKEIEAVQLNILNAQPLEVEAELAQGDEQDFELMF
jgi:hypothetical protein